MLPRGMGALRRAPVLTADAFIFPIHRFGLFLAASTRPNGRRGPERRVRWPVAQLRSSPA
jgi:hypothetical protein